MLCPRPFESAFVLALLSFSSWQGFVLEEAGVRLRLFGGLRCLGRLRDSCRPMPFDEVFFYGVHISVAGRLALPRVSCLG